MNLYLKVKVNASQSLHHGESKKAIFLLLGHLRGNRARRMRNNFSQKVNPDIFKSLKSIPTSQFPCLKEKSKLIPVMGGGKLSPGCVSETLMFLFPKTCRGRKSLHTAPGRKY